MQYSPRPDVVQDFPPDAGDEASSLLSRLLYSLRETEENVCSSEIITKVLRQFFSLSSRLRSPGVSKCQIWRNAIFLRKHVIISVAAICQMDRGAAVRAVSGLFQRPSRQAAPAVAGSRP